MDAPLWNIFQFLTNKFHFCQQNILNCCDYFMKNSAIKLKNNFDTNNFSIILGIPRITSRSRIQNCSHRLKDKRWQRQPSSHLLSRLRFRNSAESCRLRPRLRSSSRLCRWNRSRSTSRTFSTFPFSKILTAWKARKHRENCETIQRNKTVFFSKWKSLFINSITQQWIQKL